MCNIFYRTLFFWLSSSNNLFFPLRELCNTHFNLFPNFKHSWTSIGFFLFCGGLNPFTSQYFGHCHGWCRSVRKFHCPKHPVYSLTNTNAHWHTLVHKTDTHTHTTHVNIYLQTCTHTHLHTKKTRTRRVCFVRISFDEGWRLHRHSALFPSPALCTPPTLYIKAETHARTRLIISLP